MQYLYQHPRPRHEDNFLQVEASTAPAGTSPSGPMPECRKTPITMADPVNSDEKLTHSSDYRGNYHKGLNHDQFGLVDETDYQQMIAILDSPTANPGDYENIPLDDGRPLTNPQAGKATDVMGPHPATLKMLPAPTVDSPETAVEAIELYWMALLRDVPFIDWSKNILVGMAAKELSSHSLNFFGPVEADHVTRRTLFRGCAPGDTAGPYISQFLLRDIPYGSLTICQQQRTAKPGIDYLTDFNSWRAAENGAIINPQAAYDPQHRYIRNLRDLAEYVHVDALYEGYLNAALMLLGASAPVNAGNPYKHTTRQTGFGTWGGPHILSLVCEVATRALKGVWWQKWYQHRRLRPEAFGGLVDVTLRQSNAKQLLDPSNPVLSSQALEISRTTHGSNLLPMAFPEGSPTHPAYGAGHATVAGACVTILKAFFDESAVITNPVVPSADGLSLEAYTGNEKLTVGGELNKLAANISIGRNAGGVHWRSDYTESVRLGECIAVYILSHQSSDYHEDWSVQFTKFDGEQVEIKKGNVVSLSAKACAAP